MASSKSHQQIDATEDTSALIETGRPGAGRHPDHAQFTLALLRAKRFPAAGAGLHLNRLVPGR